MRKVIILLLGIFLISSASAFCDNIFHEGDQDFPVCTYSEADICIFSIYSNEGETIAYNVPTINHEGFFIYNMSNSSRGDYSVITVCDGEYGYFSFEILPPEVIGICYFINKDFTCEPKGSEYDCKRTDYTKEECEKKRHELNQQPKFLRGAYLSISYFGGLFYPSRPFFGLILFFGVVYILYSLYNSRRRVRLKFR